MTENLTHTGLYLIIGIVLYIVGGKIIGWLTGLAIQRSHTSATPPKADLDKRYKTLRGLFVNVWRFAVVAMTALGIARLFFSDAQIAPIFASAGILGVAVGFGAQSLVKDFLSGLFIISENQYRVGDVVEINEFSGTVERIGTRSTVLRDVEGNVHYFPNGLIGHVINKTMEYSMARVIVTVTPETDIEKAIQMIDEIGESMSNEEGWKDSIIEKPAFVMMGDMTATYVELIVSGKVQASRQWAVASEMRRRILRTFEDNDIDLGVGANGSAVVAYRK